MRCPKMAGGLRGQPSFQLKKMKVKMKYLMRSVAHTILRRSLETASLDKLSPDSRGMGRLVASILEAQGYVTHRSPTGADKGVDILAAPAPMGFGDPKICVQVKSSDSSLDRPTLDQLIGTMQNMNAQYGLLVSWGGFKSSVDKEKASQFFKVRLWDQNDLIDNFLPHYDELDDEIRAEIPLKRIWTLSVGD